MRRSIRKAGAGSDKQRFPAMSPAERLDFYRRSGERLREFMVEGMPRWEAFPLAVEETLHLKALPRKPKR